MTLRQFHAILRSDFERSYDIVSHDIVKFDTDVTTDFEFYLNRIDKIFITRESEYKSFKRLYIKSFSASDLEAFTFTTLEIPSYTLDTRDVIVTEQDNRRFTMRDIVI